MLRASQILDLAHLATQTADDGALQEDLLRLFDGQCTRLLPIVASDYPAIERADAAHTLKGGARAIGAWRVASLAEMLETVLDEGAPPETVARLVEKLDGAVATLRGVIHRRTRAAA